MQLKIVLETAMPTAVNYAQQAKQLIRRVNYSQRMH